MLPTVHTLNRAADGWLAYVADATWQASLLALLALLVTRLGRRWPAPLRAAVLVVAVVKFLVPPLLPAPGGLVRVPERAAAPVAASAAAEPDVSRAQFTTAKPVAVDVTAAGTVATPSRAPAPAAPSLTAALMLLHIAGSAVVAMMVCLSILRLRRLVRRAEAVRDGPLYERMLTVAARLRMRPPREVLVSDERVPPMAFGLLRPRVVLPRAVVEALPGREVEVILAHELAHHRRRDAAVTGVQLLVLVAWWFNPLAWLLARALRRAREECCDDVVLGEGVATPVEYCRTILAAVERLAVPVAHAGPLAAAEPMHPLGGRVRRIMDPTLRRTPRLPRRGLAAVLLLAAVVLPGVRSRAEDQPAQSTTTGNAPPASTAPATELKLPVHAGPKAQAAMHATLRHFAAAGERLEDVLRRLERDAGVTLDVRWDALGAAKIAHDTPVTLSADKTSAWCVLQAVLAAAREAGGGERTAALAPVIQTLDGGTVLVTTRRHLFANFLSERRYDIADLLPPPPFQPAEHEELLEEFTTLVQETVDPESWRAGPNTTGGDVRAAGTALLITQTDENHRQVVRLLAAMRKRRDAPPVPEPEPKPARLIRVALHARVGDVRLSGRPLSDAFAELRMNTGQNVFINWRALEDVRVTKDLPVTTDLSGLTLSQALDKLLAEVAGTQTRLGYAVDDDVITVSTLDDLGRNTVTRVYDIRKALRNRETREKDLAALIARLRGIDPLSWRDAGGSVGAVRELSGQIIVTQSPEVHERIVEELKEVLPVNARQFPIQSRRIGQQE